MVTIIWMNSVMTIGAIMPSRPMFPTLPFTEAVTIMSNKPFVINITHVGANLIPPGLPKHRSGWTDVLLSDGAIIRLGEMSPIESAAVLREAGIDCTEWSGRIDQWVETGKIPPPSIQPRPQEQRPHPVRLVQWVQSQQSDSGGK
jgi:hypothetical protein